MNRSASAAEAQAVSASEAAALFADFVVYSKLLLAVSGGPDSMALLLLAARWRAGGVAGPDLYAATIDHGLRAGSRQEADQAGAAAIRLGVPHQVLHWSGVKPDTGIEAAARAARYRLLLTHARRIGADAIVLAHTLDEQAETVLMRLAAGSGPAGLSAMRPVEMAEGVALLRPLLGVAKARLVATLQLEGLAFGEDPMNADLRFARPRLRAACAALTREGLSAKRLALLARRMARAEEVVAAAAAAFGEKVALSGRKGRLDGRLLARGPEELALRVLGGAIAAAGAAEKWLPVRLGRLESLWAELKAALDAGRPLRRTLAGALIVAQSDGTVAVTAAPPRRRNAATGAGKRPSAAPQRSVAAGKTFTRNDAVEADSLGIEGGGTYIAVRSNAGRRLAGMRGPRRMPRPPSTKDTG